MEIFCKGFCFYVVFCSVSFAFRSNNCVCTARAKMKCPIRGMCAVVQ